MIHEVGGMEGERALLVVDRLFKKSLGLVWVEKHSESSPSFYHVAYFEHGKSTVSYVFRNPLKVD